MAIVRAELTFQSPLGADRFDAVAALRTDHSWICSITEMALGDP